MTANIYSSTDSILTRCIIIISQFDGLSNIDHPTNFHIITMIHLSKFICPQRCPNAVVSQEGGGWISYHNQALRVFRVFAALPHLTFNLKVRAHKMPEIRDFLPHSVRQSLHVTVLSPSVVQLLQVVTAVGRVVVGLVHQVTVPTVPGLPQQVLLKSERDILERMIYNVNAL